MSDITFLEEKQITGNNQLEIFKKYGTKCAITDFSILLGGSVSNVYHTSEGTSMSDRTGWYWTRTIDANCARAVSEVGTSSYSIVDERNGGCRPALPYSSIKLVSSNGMRDANGILEVKYGEYPQTVVNDKLSKELESYYDVSCLTKTGKKYTTDSRKLSKFSPRTFEEYEYNGQKYVRFVGDYICKGEKLSDRREIQEGQYYWVKVEPIVWQVDEKADIAVTKKLIFSGVQFKNTRGSKGDFSKTDIKKFIDNYFAKEILSNEMAELQTELQKKTIRLFTSKNYTCGSNVLGIGYCTDLAKLSGYDMKYNLLADGFDVSRGNRCTCIDVTSGKIVARILIGYYKNGIRPTIEFENENYIINNGKQIDDSIYEINIGEFPQSIVSNYEDDKLDEKLAKGELVETGRKYTFHDSNTDFNRNFKPYQYDEYVDKDGSKYIHYIPRDKTIIIPTSSDKTYRWVKVEPLTWYYDTKEKLLYTKNVIVSGIRCGDYEKTRTFMHTDVYKYLNTYFKQEVFSSYGVTKSNHDLDDYEKEIKAIKRDNVYEFDLNRVNEEEIIEGCIKGNIPVFLHGESSEGKSARVKQIDPDCVILYLSNATPESLNGKSVYDPNKGEIIDMPPSWYVKLKNKCEEEPDDIHVLFFDELTNALPSIQGMAFNIILDREVNGVWKLPSNCRIAASGNDMDESLAANELAKPLFNRLAHVYIKTTVPNWLKWASKNNIHPAIYAFVAYNGEKVLRTPYNGEKPHADPRRWEMASKMLYATNNPYLLRGILGEGITEQLVVFCKQTVITLDDVLNHNYTNEDLKMNTGQKYMTAVGLSLVDEEHVKEVREFVTMLGAEICATFDSMWSHGDEERIKKLAEIDMLEGGIKR